jgi:hypothetical protein
MLTVSGIEPLQFAGTGLTLNRGQPLSFTWTAPAKVTGKIQAALNIAYHGGGRYRIDCDFDDDGAGEIPAALIDKLLDQGTAGFPTLALTRRSVDSTMVASLGCVEFEVNAFRQREITVCPMPNQCIITCGPDKPCPTGKPAATTRSVHDAKGLRPRRREGGLRPPRGLPRRTLLTLAGVAEPHLPSLNPGAVAPSDATAKT